MPTVTMIPQVYNCYIFNFANTNCNYDSTKVSPLAFIVQNRLQTLIDMLQADENRVRLHLL